MQRFQPSPSYEILLPDDVTIQSDERVCSFWIAGQPILLQVSSYIKQDADLPIPPASRLRDRIAKSSQGCRVWEGKSFLIPGADHAVGETVDENGLHWVHAYIVWPHLTVHVTISGPDDLVHASHNWAQAAMESLRLRVQ